MDTRCIVEFVELYGSTKPTLYNSLYSSANISSVVETKTEWGSGRYTSVRRELQDVCLGEGGVVICRQNP